MCLNPKTIRNKRFTINKKNGGEIPSVKDERTVNIEIGCGKCHLCRKKRSNGWQTRLIEEIKNKEEKAWFVTIVLNKFHSYNYENNQQN